MKSKIKNDFFITNEYLLFTELCNECKDNKYIGICYGSPGVGKTLSTRHYTNWDTIEPVFPPAHLINPLPLDEISQCDSVFYTAPVTSSPARIEREISKLIFNMNWLVDDIKTNKVRKKGSWDKQNNATKLIIIDEADRLKPASLEQVRNIYDTRKVGMLLIGMPGIEKKFSRFAQLYSRIGFVHHFQTIDKDDIWGIVKRKAIEIGINTEVETQDLKEAFAEIIRITQGNFRHIQRLFTQISRLMKVNNVSELDKELVNTAKSSLIIGTL